MFGILIDTIKIASSLSSCHYQRLSRGKKCENMNVESYGIRHSNVETHGIQHLNVKTHDIRHSNVEI